jgi:hypothetical protein
MDTDCQHVCRCECHTTKGMMHFMPCCYPCKECGKRIPNRQLQGHIMACHAPQILDALTDKNKKEE